MLGWARRLIAAFVTVVALAVTLGAANAWAGGNAVHVGPIAGVIKPIGSATSSAATVTPAPEFDAGATASGSSTPACSQCSPPLLYWGGPVMHAVTTHVIAWAPSGYPFPSGYVSGYETFLFDLQHDLGQGGNISSIAAQYLDATGSALGSLSNDAAITDSIAYPASGCSVPGAAVCLTEQQLVNEVASTIAEDSLSINLSQSYVLLLPPGVDSCVDSSATVCEDQAFCGYHDTIYIGAAETTFTLLPYTASSYSNAQGDCYDNQGPASVSPDLMALDSVGAHELLESATDPVVGTGYLDSTGYEIGDECAWYYGSTSTATGGGAYNQVLNGNQYLIQNMWSNQDNSCEPGDASTPTATITPSTNPTMNASTSFSASLSGASATGATYAWSYVDPNGNFDQDVSTSATPRLTLSVPGTYTVWVEITDAGGGTITGVSAVTVASAPTAAFTYTTQTVVPAAGTPVSFSNASSAYSGQTISGSSWNFGDGSTSSLSDPTHTYSTAGTYTVTLTVTETNNVTAETSQTITVDAPPTAVFTSAANPTAGTSLAFSSAGSAAGTGSIAGYSWSFGDGGTSTTASPSHTYSSAGIYTATLAVTQTDGLTASVQHTVTVAAPPSSGGTGGSSGSSSSGTSTASAGPSGSSGSTSSGTSTGSATTNAHANVTFWLAHVLTATRGSGKITRLLKQHHTTTIVSAPSFTGHLMMTWYATVKRHRVVVARGSTSLTAGVAAHIVIKLTRAGRALLARSRTVRIRITASGIYRFGGSSVSVTRKLTLKRR